MDSPERLAVSSAAPTHQIFIARSYDALFSPVLEPWAVQSGLGLGSLFPHLVFNHHT